MIKNIATENVFVSYVAPVGTLKRIIIKIDHHCLVIVIRELSNDDGNGKANVT